MSDRTPRRAALPSSPRERILAILRQRLRDGRYRTGERLPAERRLAPELGVSRAVLRGALAVLEAEGTLWRGVGRGTYVGRPRLDRGAPAVAGMLAAMGDLTSPTEVMEVRIGLEPRLACLAAHRATASELDEVERCCDKAAAAQVQLTYELWDGRFHRAIAVATHNRLYLALFEAVNAVRDEASWGQVREARRAPGRNLETAAQHRAVLEALRRRDAAGAEERMTAHLRSVAAYLLAGVPPADGSGADGYDTPT